MYAGWQHVSVCPQLAAYEKVRQSKLGQLQALASSFQVRE